MNDLNLYSVNWQDGMLISQRHLMDQEKYFENLIRWHAATSSDNFGLVRRSSTDQPSLAMNLSVSGERVRAELTRCQAITPGGHYVEVSGTEQNTVVADHQGTGDAEIAVYLSVNPEAKTQVGQPDPGEDVPRVPYLVTSYGLHLGTPPSIPEDQYMQIAQLTLVGGEVQLSPTFYPPCVTIWADDRLNQKAIELRNRLENLLSLTSRAYTAITTAGALSDESSSLQVAFKETTYHFAYHLSSMLDDCITGHNAPHPMRMVVLFKRVFRVFSTLLNLQPGLKDYLNERYFSKELNSDIGRFMASVDAFLLSTYNHRDLGGQIKMIDETVVTLRGVLGFLAQLKKEQLGPQAVATDSLTYGGKTYRIANYGTCKVEQVGELAYVLIDLPQATAVSDMVALMSKDLFSIPEWNNMQVRLGLNAARGLGETDPVDIDTVAYGDKVALHPQDMLKSPAVTQMTLIFRGARDMSKLAALSKSDLNVYSV